MASTCCGISNKHFAMIKNNMYKIFQSFKLFFNFYLSNALTNFISSYILKLHYDYLH